MQEEILARKLRFFVIDAYRIAREAGLKGRINTIMQTCFFAITKTLSPEIATARIKQAISDTYAKKGAEVLKRNFAAVDAALGGLAEVRVPGSATATRRRPPIVSGAAPGLRPEASRRVMLAGHGDRLPVSAFPVDGTWPTATAQWEKRNIATEIPVWDPAVCIQCNKCALVCPARRDPREGLRAREARRRPRDVQVRPVPRRRFRGLALHDPGRARGLHRAARSA